MSTYKFELCNKMNTTDKTLISPFSLASLAPFSLPPSLPAGLPSGLSILPSLLAESFSDFSSLLFS